MSINDLSLKGIPINKEMFYNSVKQLGGHMPRDGYMTIEEMSEILGIAKAKIRTIIARLDIQPRRFPDDMRKLYYGQDDLERVRHALGMIR